MSARRSLLLVGVFGALLVVLGILGARLLGEDAASEAASLPGEEPAAAPASSNPSDAAAQVTWSLDYEASLARARAERLPILIDFFADWCSPCKELDSITYRDPRVVEAARRFVTLKVDGTDEDDAVDALYERYGVQGLPTLVFIDSAGTILDEPRALGFVDGDELLEMMAKVR